MKLVFAFDSFKGTVDARRLCEISIDFFAGKEPAWQCVSMPLADGGENTAEIIAANLGGELKSLGNAQGPVDGMMCDGDYVLLPSSKSVVEMANCSGLAQLGLDGKNPLGSTTFGTGQVLRHLIDEGSQEIMLTLGGSATNDGACGAAAAAGWKFYNSSGDTFVPRGGSLLEIVDFEPPSDWDQWPSVLALCDVRNSMTGPNGAAHVFGPQKGADEKEIELIDQGLSHLAKLFREKLGLDVEHFPGSGAAGGFGGGAMAFFKAKLVPGIDTILDWFNADKKVADADWLISGEGCLDNTSFQGKVVGGICTRYHKNLNLKRAVLAGLVKANKEKTEQAGLMYVGQCMKKGQTEAEAFAQAEENFISALENFYQYLKS